MKDIVEVKLYGNPKLITGISSYASDYGLEYIDLSKLTELRGLELQGHSLEYLDISNNHLLEILAVGMNRLVSLDASNNERLRTLRVYQNPLLENREQVVQLVNSLPQILEPDDSGSFAGELSDELLEEVKPILEAKGWSYR